MAKNYTIESKEGITIIRLIKEAGLEDLCHAIDDVANNFLSDLRLWDISCGVNLTDTEISQLAEYGKSKFFIPSKIAIVAPKDLAFGIARMHDVYRKDDLVEQEVFRTEQEAWAWLKSQSKDPGAI